MSDWPCTLVERQQTSGEVGEFLTLKAHKQLAGTFQNAAGDVIITYDPTLVWRPYNLIATFAHELAHCMTSRSRRPARISNRNCANWRPTLRSRSTGLR
jgi:hypothetical protein